MPRHDKRPLAGDFASGVVMWVKGFLFGVFCLLATASSVDRALNFQRLLTMADVERLLTSAQAPKTVEELLQRIPEVYRQYYVLQYRSFSQHSATMEFPRIILYGPDAKLITAISGNPNDEHFNTVEFIEYQPADGRFHFSAATFGQGKPLLEKDPARCHGCHGRDARPNWEPYSIWPGTYGSMHDRLPPGNVENQAFASFVSKFPANDRYRALSPNFYMRSPQFNGQSEYYTLSGGVGSSSAFTLLLNFLNRDRITKQIIRMPDHARYRGAITASLIGCPRPPSDYLSAELLANHPKSFDLILADTKRLLRQDHDRRNLQITKLLQIDLESVLPHSDEFGMRDSDARRIAGLRYLLENRRVGALNMDRWSMGVHRTSYGFNDGVSGLENLLGHYLELAYAADDPLRAKMPIQPTDFSFTSLGALPGAFSIRHAHGGENAYPIVLFQRIHEALGACDSLK